MPLGASRLAFLALPGGETPVRSSDATWTNGTGTSTTSGKFNNAIRISYYASSQSYITLGNSATGNGSIDDSNVITLEGWIGGNGDRGPFVGTTSFGANWLPSTNHFYIYSNASNQWYFHRPGGTNVAVSEASSSGTHWAYQLNGDGTSTAWWNGSRVWTNASTSQDLSTRLYVGYGDYKNASYPGALNIWHDELRVTWGTARYTSNANLTVPTSAFTNDASTLALFHCESTSQSDDSA